MIYTIENQYLRATFNDKGAECIRLYDKLAKIDYLWNGDEKYWGRHAPVLFPIVGRLKHNQYIYNGDTYEMSGHGFARDQFFSLFKQDNSSLSFVLSFNEETLKHYPFKFRLMITYTLVDHTLDVTYQVDNLSHDAMYFSIGGHPAFNLPLQSENFEDWRLTIKADEKAKRYYVSGVLIDDVQTQKTTLPLNEPLTHKMFEKDALIYQTEGPTQVILSNIKNHAEIILHYHQAPYIGIWSPYPKEAPFICLEPWWGIADFINSTKCLKEKVGIIELPSQECWKATYQMTVHSE